MYKCHVDGGCAMSAVSCTIVGDVVVVYFCVWEPRVFKIDVAILRGHPDSAMSMQTALWVVKQCRHMDWVSRHEVLARLAAHRPRIHARIVKLMGPDEALDGTWSGVVLSPGCTVIAKNGYVKAKHVQKTLHSYFRMRRNRHRAHRR